MWRENYMNENTQINSRTQCGQYNSVMLAVDLFCVINNSLGSCKTFKGKKTLGFPFRYILAEKGRFCNDNLLLALAESFKNLSLIRFCRMRWSARFNQGREQRDIKKCDSKYKTKLLDFSHCLSCFVPRISKIRLIDQPENDRKTTSDFLHLYVAFPDCYERSRIHTRSPHKLWAL